MRVTAVCFRLAQGRQEARRRRTCPLPIDRFCHLQLLYRRHLTLEMEGIDMTGRRRARSSNGARDYRHDARRLNNPPAGLAPTYEVRERRARHCIRAR